MHQSGFQMDLSTIHILEIGDHHHFKQTFFERTKLLWTGRKRPMTCAHDYVDCTPRSFIKAMRDVAAGSLTSWLPMPASDRRGIPVIGCALYSELAAADRRSPRVWCELAALCTAARTISRAGYARYSDHPSVQFFSSRLCPRVFQARVACRLLAESVWNSACQSANFEDSAKSAMAKSDREAATNLASGRLDRSRPFRFGYFSGKTADVFFAGAVDGNSTVRDSGCNNCRNWRTGA